MPGHPATSPACKPVTAVPATGQPADYLRFPTTANVNTSALTENPAAQFRVFEAGQHTVTGPLVTGWPTPGSSTRGAALSCTSTTPAPCISAASEGSCRRWPTVRAVSSPGDVPDLSDGLIGLQYWFFYPYNYYPLVTRSSLMNGAPVAGDVENVDLHQGDWEHVDVLLDERTLNPVALYMARHANEGKFYYWNSKKLTFDGPGRLHPIVQAAIGGHPSLPEHVRWLQTLDRAAARCTTGSCAAAGGMRSAPPPPRSSTSVRRAGRAGPVTSARPGTGLRSSTPLPTPRQDIAKYVHVAGPVSPLRQAENGQDPGYGVCTRGAGASETTRCTDRSRRC